MRYINLYQFEWAMNVYKQAGVTEEERRVIDSALCIARACSDVNIPMYKEMEEAENGRETNGI